MATEIPNTNTYSGGAYYLPDPTDSGDADLWSHLEDFINRMAVHNHSGNDSKVITAQFEKSYQEFVSGVNYVWTEISSTGRYECTITLTGNEIDVHERQFYASIDSGITYKQTYFSWDKTSSNQIKIYSIDNNIDKIKIVSF